MQTFHCALPYVSQGHLPYLAAEEGGWQEWPGIKAPSLFEGKCGLLYACWGYDAVHPVFFNLGCVSGMACVLSSCRDVCGISTPFLAPLAFHNPGGVALTSITFGITSGFPIIV